LSQLNTVYVFTTVFYKIQASNILLSPIACP